VTTDAEHPPIATPHIAAAVLFTDEAGRVLLVKPVYKDGWDLPGGYIMPGESPRAACTREVREELGIEPPIGDALVVDWAPLEGEGDKILFVFDGGRLTEDNHARIHFADGEIKDLRYVSVDELDGYVPARLSRRIRTASSGHHTVYAEHGTRS
jgi:8-oxo-dGTP pyrophosphatase MutT (NUDIX family)